ncbi:hypothetical protein KQ876_02465 [Mycoplasma sp. CSL7491-lung]|uniref:hypothetical protein n=1 Tax=Mycoplasma sp. CSL7491-lung TaxID=549718 RepID=UPI001C11D597|nr:hypothetical protein [Mycoplasma sp. CSL7491-lung]MBU4693068.1 hypothetical protein [Mycoplasma sp. CSL7491-lung]
MDKNKKLALTNLLSKILILILIIVIIAINVTSAVKATNNYNNYGYGNYYTNKSEVYNSAKGVLIGSIIIGILLFAFSIVILVTHIILAINTKDKIRTLLLIGFIVPFATFAATIMILSSSKKEFVNKNKIITD